MKRILMVDDDKRLTDMMAEYLLLEGFSVEALHDGKSCLRADLSTKDLVILDVMLPGMNGIEVLRRIRQRSFIPVIMLTARDADVDRIVGLEVGADDYVAKPVNPRELVARIRAVLRRATGATPTNDGSIAVADVRLNPASRDGWSGARRLELTTAEFNLLEHLLRNAGRIVSRDDLSAAAFGRHTTLGTDRNVDTLVSKVRRKLGTAGDAAGLIKTIRTIGYLYVLPSEPSGNESSDAGTNREP